MPSLLDQHRRVMGLRDKYAHLVPASQPRPTGTTLCGVTERSFLHSGHLAENKPTCPDCKNLINAMGRSQ